jgi:hypothetical protein
VSSKAIQPGDLVIAWRTHCDGHTAPLGKVRTVRQVKPAYDGLICPGCGQEFAHSQHIARLEGGWMPLAWLRKIDPLKEPETVERPEGVTA